MSDLGGPSSQAFLQGLLALVQATNAQSQIIKGNISGLVASGDLFGTYPGPINVTATHLTVALPIGQGGTGNTTGQPSGAAGGSLTGTYPNPGLSGAAVIASIGTLPVANGGTGLTSGTSGGVPGYTATGVLTASALLANHEIVLGGGAGATPATLGSLGTTTTVLHGNAAGAPSYGAVVLTADVSGILPVANGGTGNATGAPAGAAGGDLSGTYPNPTVAQVAGIAVAPASWTPVLRFGGASVGITYGTQTGNVIRIGKLVIASFTFTLTSKGVSVGTATLSGLPATCGAVDGAVAISSHAAMGTSNVFECSVATGTALVSFGKGNAAASAVLIDTDFTNTTQIAGTATYISA